MVQTYGYCLMGSICSQCTRTSWICLFVLLVVAGISLQVMLVSLWSDVTMRKYRVWFDAPEAGGMKVYSYRGNTMDSLPLSNYSRWLSYERFPRLITQEQHREYLRILEAFVGILERANVTYVMGSGTLIGSYMSHDMIPWDDDMDFLIPFEHMERLKWAMEVACNGSEFRVIGYQDPTDEYDFNVSAETRAARFTQNHYHKFKFYSIHSPKAGAYKWRWPFVDGEYYKQDATHITNMDYTGIFHVRVEDFYPLQRRPFFHLWLPAPRNTRQYLLGKYKRLVCATWTWDHSKEKPKSSKHVKCNSLYKYYPFVWRKPFGSGTLEALILHDEIIQVVQTDEPFYPNQAPFVL